MIKAKRHATVKISHNPHNPHNPHKMTHNMAHKIIKPLSSMRRVLLLGVVLVILTGVIFTYTRGQKNQNSTFMHLSPSAPTASTLREAPVFTLPSRAGKIVSLKDFQGATVILHFWASWCPPCLDEIPQWVELGAFFKNRPLKLVAISLDQKWDDALKILPDQNLPNNITSLLDMSGKTPDVYGTFQFPETYLISPESKIIMKWVGPQDWSSPQIHEFIERFLK